MSHSVNRDYGDDAWKWWKRVRASQPLIHCITNFVSMDLMANTLLSLGASPAMIHAESEVAEFLCNGPAALLVNVGTLDPAWQVGMCTAVEKAKELGTPWVLDPVAAGATTARKGFIEELLKFSPTVIRGNPSEIHSLAGNLGTSKGADSTLASNEALVSAKILSKATNSVVAVTGADDYVTDGEIVLKISNGVPLMQKITASGCALSAVVAAFISVDHSSIIEATAFALAAYGVIGEVALESATVKGPGSLRTGMLDWLHCVEEEAFVSKVKIVKE